MPRKHTVLSENLEETREGIAETKKEAAATLNDTSIAEKLDLMVLYLHHLDRRDRIRTIGAFFRSILGLIPLALLLWSAWYFMEHGEEFVQQITKEAVRQSAEYSQGTLMQQLEQYMQQQ